jgi:RNA polymerase sigma factor (sigma-70 family)
MLGEQFSEVLEGARAGSEQAFSRLYKDLNASLLRYFAAHAPSEAQDLTADTWLAAASNLHAFEGDERAFRAWLFTIAHRKLVQHWRDLGRRPVQPAGAELFAAIVDASDTEQRALAGSEAAAAARTLAALLTPDQAHVVLLRVLGGLTVDEVAAAMGKRPGTVRVLQHRALRRLAEKLSKLSLEGVTR